MAQDQQTSARVAAIASKALQNPNSLTAEEIKTLAASVQNQSSGQQNQQNKQQNR